MYQVNELLNHPVLGILLGFIGLFIFYMFLKLVLKYTVKAKI